MAGAVEVGASTSLTCGVRNDVTALPSVFLLRSVVPLPPALCFFPSSFLSLLCASPPCSPFLVVSFPFPLPFRFVSLPRVWFLLSLFGLVASPSSLMVGALLRGVATGGGYGANTLPLLACVLPPYLPSSVALPFVSFCLLAGLPSSRGTTSRSVWKSMSAFIVRSRFSLLARSSRCVVAVFWVDVAACRRHLTYELRVRNVRPPARVHSEIWRTMLPG